GKKLIRDDLKMRITLPRRNDSTAQIRLDHINLRRHRTVKESEIDRVAMAALVARVQAGKDCNAGIQPGQNIGHRDADLARRPFDRSRDAHESAERLNRKVIARQVTKWTGAAEARDGTEDKTRIYVEQFLRAQPKSIRTGCLEILQKYIAT